MKRKGTHGERLLALLSDGRPHSNSAVAKVAGFLYGAVIHNLRNNGAEIETIHRNGDPPELWFYRLAKT